VAFCQLAAGRIAAERGELSHYHGEAIHSRRDGACRDRPVMPPQSRVAYVLTYHSQNVTGSRYEQSDRIAFGFDLDLLKELGFNVVSALQLARALRNRAFATLPQRCVVLTMDDGPLVDFAESDIPPHVGQESMLSALRRQHKTILGFPIGKPPAVATSFVIASPSARQQLSAPVKMPWFNDTWWLAAQQSGYLDLGTHSWNHVHPDVDELAGMPHLKAAFNQLDTVEEADRQILQASRTVRAHEAPRSRSVRLALWPNK